MTDAGDAEHSCYRYVRVIYVCIQRDTWPRYSHRDAYYTRLLYNWIALKIDKSIDSSADEFREPVNIHFIAEGSADCLSTSEMRNRTFLKHETDYS